MFCAINTSILINGEVVNIEMRRDHFGCNWKFDAGFEGEEEFALDINTQTCDFEIAAEVITNYVRSL